LNAEEQKGEDDMVDLQMELASERAKSQSKLDDEELKRIKLNLTALPAGLMNAKMRSSGGHRRSKKGKNNDTIVSKPYNTVASRPIQHIKDKGQIYAANLRFDQTNVFTSSTTVPAFYGTSIQLNNFIGYTQYVGLFDDYWIVGLEAWMEPVNSQGSVITNVGEFTTAVDLDDAVTPTTIQTVEDKQSALTTGGMNGHYHKWAPRVAVSYYTGTFVGFGSAPSSWIDCGTPNVQHYGIKVATSATSTAITYNLQIRGRVLFRHAGL